MGSEFSFLVDIFQETPEIDEDFEDWNESISLERSIIQSMPTLQATPSISDRKAQVLIVDDNDFNRAVVSEFLEEAGLSYHEACTGLEAVEKVLQFNKGEEGYKVVLMDCEMPVMNGWEATKSIMQMWEEAKIELLPAVIGYTAYSGSAEARRCQEAGMICYLNKPVPRKELVETIKRYLV
jgi:CheY-like chemotaxis protein